MELNLYHSLVNAGIKPEDAQNVVEAWEREMREQLATKSDMAALYAAMHADMANLKAELIKWVSGMMVAMTAIFAAIVKLL